MGITLAKDAVKIGFADISIQDGTPSQPFFGYFADSEMSVEQRTALAFRLGAEENCFKQPVFKEEEYKINSNNNCGCESESNTNSMPLPTNQNLTLPPNTKQFLDNPYVQAAVIGAGVFLFIKLVS